MTGPVLRFLGETQLELGPAEAVEPRQGWRSATAPDGIAWLVLDCPGTGTNTISEAVIRELSERLKEFEATPPEALVIRSAKLSGFAAGADIGGFAALDHQDAVELLRQGHEVLDRLERLSFPTIAVVHGQALGGGFELALACDHRILIEGGSVGFPEVQLGLHPGLGGTFRLTSLIEPTEAMTLMLTGKTAHTGKAKKLGIADVVTEERHVAAAVAALASGRAPERGNGLMARAFGLRQARSLAARKMRAETEDKAPKAHYPAPHALIDLWEEHGDDRKAMQDAEIASFARMLGTETARNLIRVFFLRQKLREAARGDSGIDHVHVVGAGAMGADIAAWCAIRGKTVTLGDVQLGPLGRAVKAAGETCKAAHLDHRQTRDALDRLIPDPSGYGVAQADLVIEAVPEESDLKARIYDGVVGRMKPEAILASNTSSLRLARLAETLPHPARFAGLHFFNPVPKMQLVEVVEHARTDPSVADRLAAFCGDIGRLPARVGDHPGFLVNRALMPYLMEALVLMDEGIEKAVIDRAAVRFGMPMGPVALADQVGLDICLDVAESLKGDLDKPLADLPPMLRERVEKGETGRKAGKGFHDWTAGTPRPGEGESGPEDLTDRLILPMLDACVECLRKGVARDADQIDGAIIFATGFPPFRGGPMHYARTRGIEEIRGRLGELADRHGERFAPDEGWADLQ